MEITWRVINRGVGGAREGGKVQRISSINGRQKIRQGEGKNSVGNLEAKELISMTNGHELQGGMWEGGGGQDGVEWGGGKWDNCNSIINKYTKKSFQIGGVNQGENTTFTSVCFWFTKAQSSTLL